MSSILEGIDLQQAVRRSVQEALEDYFPMQSSNSPTQSADVDVRAVTSQRFNPDSVSQQTGSRYPQGRSNRGRRGSNRSLTCWNCGEPGHIRARYLKPRRDGGNCTCCGGRGHSQGECPTWQRERDGRNSTRATNATISSQVAKHDDGIFVNLQIAGENIKFLVDTGSSISMVHHSNGLPLQVTGTIEADIGLGLESTTHKFYVTSDIKSDGILGLDLKRLGATVDIKRGYLFMGPTKLPMLHCQRDVKVPRIILKENTTIPYLPTMKLFFQQKLRLKDIPAALKVLWNQMQVLYRKLAYW